MKKLLSLITAALLLAGANCFAAKKSIVCTTYPQYDWVMNILGSKSEFEVTLLQDKGTDLHSFQPSFKDITKVADCDLFVYVGGESDTWVGDALKNSRNKNQIAVNMMEVLGDKVREEEIVEGMQAEEEEDEDLDHEEAGHHHDEAPEYDEHVWLSLRNAEVVVNALAQNIAHHQAKCVYDIQTVRPDMNVPVALDVKNANLYTENAAAYSKQLADLDAEYLKMVKAAGKKTVLFGDRFPFRYLVDDYGIKYYAAFVGCSAESEASFETIKFLAGKVDDLGLSSVLTIEKSDKKIAKTIVQSSNNKNCKILEMNSIQSVTKKDIKNGISYLKIMKGNLDVLKESLK